MNINKYYIWNDAIILVLALLYIVITQFYIQNLNSRHYREIQEINDKHINYCLEIEEKLVNKEDEIKTLISQIHMVKEQYNLHKEKQ